MGAGGPPHFEIRESRDPTGGVRLSLIGELDLAAIGVLQARLREAKDARTAVKLDLFGLEFLDSSGLRALIEGADDARRDGWQLEIDDAVRPQVRRVIDLVGVAPILWPADGPVAQSSEAASATHQPESTEASASV